MNILSIVIQVFLAVAMFDVWLFRYRTPGIFRGGDSTTMEEEFRVYGLPDWFRNLVRVLKLTAGVCMILGIWYDMVGLFAGVLLSILMAGAVAMHVKVRDPAFKAIPSTSFLAMSIWVVWFYRDALVS
jgi:hypothetical protein